MNVWMKDNLVTVSIATICVCVVFIVGTTLTYAEKEGEQTAAIREAQRLAIQNQKDICDLTDMVKTHMATAEIASRKTIKMEADVDHIKGDIGEIKYMLRRKDRDAYNYSVPTYDPNNGHGE